MENNAITLENVSYSYDKKNDVLKNINLTIPKGHFLSVIGHNGSGKSTFAKLIMGLLEAKEGTIKIFDDELNAENINKIRPHLGIVFQNPDNQFIGATVRDDIAFGLENRCYKKEDMDVIIDEYSKKVGMHEFLDKEPGNLSGGQKQRVAIAGVLAMKPDILILDEATAMLDPKGKKEILSLINEIREKNKNLTIISITHNIEETLTSDEVIVFNQGEVYLYGKPDEIFKNPAKLKDIRLDIPFIYRLKEAFSNKGVNLKAMDLDALAEELCQ
ncbi:MAG: energy-coupling factor transporter ATPase [Bacilli bacterium]|jgi:energy-coupling factor transport system ATP-binding protein